MKSCLAALSTPVTWAPSRLASWMAKDPDPPPAPLISIRLPATTRCVPRSAIAPACGMVDASANESAVGLTESADSGASAYSAKPPISARLSP